jgi:hypothetical protein
LPLYASSDVDLFPLLELPKLIHKGDRNSGSSYSSVTMDDSGSTR